MEGEIKSVVAVPLLTNGKLQGLLAGFSLSDSPFSEVTIQKFQRLADTLLQEIEPPLIVELDSENEDILDQLGFEPAQLAAEDEPNYLPEIVLEVLQETPPNPPGASETETNEVLSDLLGERKEQSPTESLQTVEKETHEIVAPETEQHAAANGETKKTEQKEQPAPGPQPIVPVAPPGDVAEAGKPFFHNTDPKRARTTEDVLMDLVQQSLHIPAVPAPAPNVEPSGDAGARAAAPTATIAALATAPAKTPAEVGANVPAEEAPEKILESVPEETLERAFPVRPPAIGLALLLVVAIGVFLIFYFRKPPMPAAQSSVATQTIATPPATPISSASQGTPANQSKDSTAAGRPDARTKQVPARVPPQQEPMTVASNGGPLRPAGTATDAGPTPLTGITAKPSSLDLPSPSTNVVFAGKRSSGVVPAKLLRRVEPKYPAMARTMHLNGDVRMDITVAEDGHVKSVANVNGAPLLASSAVEAVKKWRYTPATQDGKPVESTVEITIRFR